MTDEKNEKELLAPEEGGAIAEANELGELSIAASTPKTAEEQRQLFAQASLDQGTAEGAAPVQLGTKRFVFAGFFAFAILVAFVMTKVVDAAWYKLSQYKPQVGDAQDEIVMPIAAVIGAMVAVYYWRNQKVYKMVDEIAVELSKVTWPTKEEVWNNTTVVVVTTAAATAFFALMDYFWRFVTNFVYGS